MGGYLKRPAAAVVGERGLWPRILEIAAFGRGYGILDMGYWIWGCGMLDVDTGYGSVGYGYVFIVLGSGDAGGIRACSRGLSEAIPPEIGLCPFSTLKVCQRFAGVREFRRDWGREGRTLNF